MKYLALPPTREQTEIDGPLCALLPSPEHYITLLCIRFVFEVCATRLPFDVSIGRRRERHNWPTSRSAVLDKRSRNTRAPCRRSPLRAPAPNVRLLL